MVDLSVVLSIAVPFLAFLGGWLAATEKNRNELFKAKLNAFQEINALIANVFALNIKAEVNPEQFEIEYTSARLLAFEGVMKHGLILPDGFGDMVTCFMKKTDTEEKRKVLNKITTALADNLAIKRMEFISNLLYINYKNLLHR